MPYSTTRPLVLITLLAFVGLDQSGLLPKYSLIPVVSAVLIYFIYSEINYLLTEILNELKKLNDKLEKIAKP